MERRIKSKVQAKTHVYVIKGKRNAAKQGDNMPPDRVLKKCLREPTCNGDDCDGDRNEGDLFQIEYVQARKLAGIKQKDIAKRMGTTASAVARLEAYVPGKRPAPSLDTLLRYAQALGCRLVVKLEPLEK